MDSTTSSAYFLEGVGSLIASITPFPGFPGYLGRSRLLLYFDSERKTRNRQGRVRRLPCCPDLIHYSAEGREGAFPETGLPAFRVSGKPVYGDLGNRNPLLLVFGSTGINISPCAS